MTQDANAEPRLVRLLGRVTRLISWRRRAPSPTRVLLYKKRDCPLCDEALRDIERERARLRFTLDVVDVSDDPEKLALYGAEVPVVFVDGRKRFFGRVDPVLLRRLVRPPETWSAFGGGIAVVVLAALLFVGFAERLLSTAFERHAALEKLSRRVQQDLVAAHLWLEEAIAGDDAIDTQRDVFGPLDAVLAEVVSGAEHDAERRGFADLFDHEKAVSALRRVADSIKAYRDLAARRWLLREGEGRVGGPLDREFDAIFNRASADCGALAADMETVIAADRRIVRAGLAGMFLLLVLLASRVVSVVGRSRRELAAKNQELEARVAERTTDLLRICSEITHARDAAQDAARLKTTFLANMSHEVRTPMNAILGMTRLLLRTRLDDEQRRCADTVRKSGEALLSLLNDVLDYAKLEADALELGSGDFDPVRLLADVHDAAAGLAADKRLHIAFDAAPDVPRLVRGDAARLRQVLMNLVGNAVKFTEKGEVRTALSREPRRGDDATVVLKFVVTDTGAGIPEDGLRKLFRPFAQADASTSRRAAGAGLGLVISKELVAKMGGEISVESAVGRGSRFAFTVRLAAANPESRPPSVAALEARAEARADAPRVLVVEDNPINRELAARMLAWIGYASDAASGGRDAVDKIAAGEYAAVLMDCHMPDVDGFEAARRIRALESAGRRTPLIALTADSGDRARALALAAGMDDFVTKPVSPEDLAAVLRRHARAAPPVVPRRDEPDGAAPARAAAPADRASPAEDVLDAAGRARLGAPDQAAKLIALFARDGAARVAAMRDALASGDSAARKAAAHALKGSAAWLGAARLRDACAESETAAPDAAPAAVERAAEEFERVRVALTSTTPSPAAPA